MKAALNPPVTICFLLAALLFSISLLLLSSSSSSFLRTNPPPLPTSSSELRSALLHYATASTTPQQSRSEISISFNILRLRSPCNFLVFGLGLDSPFWSALNSGGLTLFLEEDPKWFQSLTRDFPFLRAYNVRYPTKLSQAKHLITSYRSQPDCLPPRAHLKGNRLCRLALPNLPDEVYDTEWDLIMIDGPKGYFAEAPGRMGAIYSSAVLARARRREGLTDVFLHDVDRDVEKMFAMEFLCKKFLVGGAGRLWHFQVPPVRANESVREGGFC